MLSLVLLITISLLVALSFSAGKLVRQMSRTIITACSGQVEAQLAAYFSPIEIMLSAAENPISTGQLSPLDPQQLSLFFGPMYSSVEQVAAVRACDDQGNLAVLTRRDELWVTATAKPAQAPGRMDYAGRSTLTGPPERQWTETQAEDPLASHWYKGATANRAAGSAAAPGSGPTAGVTHWTETYGFDTAVDPGVTASKLLRTPSRSQLVLAIDLLVAELDEYTDTLRPTPNGYVVVTDLKGRLLEPVSETEDHDAEAPQRFDSRIPIETDETVMFDALTAWAKLHEAVWDGKTGIVPAPSAAAAPQEEEAFQFQSRDKQWWGGMKAFYLSDEPEFYIAVLIPEADLMQTMHSQRQLLLLIAAAALVVAAGLALSIAAAFSAPIAALVEQSQRLRLLDLSPELPPVESAITEVAQLSEAHVSMRNALDSFARYVPRELVRELLSRGEAARIGGRVLPLTILITDIRGFTAITESTLPEPLAIQLAEYFDCILSALHNSGATIDKLVGDSVVAFWGAPDPVAQQAQSALAGTLQALQDLRQANSRWKREGKPALTTHAALTHGKVVVGNIGAHWRLSYTALGDAVNLASRLERINPLYGTELLASKQLVEAAGADFAWRLIDRVAVRGKLAPIEVYEPLGVRSTVSAETLSRAGQYESALRLYWEKKFAEAGAVASELVTRRPAGRASALLLERIEHYKKSPPPWNWDGVYRDAAHGAERLFED